MSKVNKQRAEFENIVQQAVFTSDALRKTARGRYSEFATRVMWENYKAGTFKPSVDTVPLIRPLLTLVETVEATGGLVNDPCTGGNVPAAELDWFDLGAAVEDAVQALGRVGIRKGINL